MVTEQQVKDTVAAIEASVTTESGIAFSRHPLYHTMWTHEGNEPAEDMPEKYRNMFGKGWLIQQMRHKLEALEEATRKKDWGGVIWLHERPYRIDVLHNLMIRDQVMDPKSRASAELVLSVWTDTEWPHQNEWRWLEVFSEVGQDLLNQALNPDELSARARLTGQVRVYRGVGGHDDSAISSRFGFSWTLDRSRAEWFANRFASYDDTPHAKVFEALVWKHCTVGPLMGRGEDEILIPEPSKITARNVGFRKTPMEMEELK